MTKCIDGCFLVARATKNIEAYSGEAAKRLSHDLVIIKKGETELFQLETIVDLTWIREFKLEEMVKLLGADISKKGSLPKYLVSRINEQVMMATTVSERWQKRILHGD